ncbi:hypothetical protein FKP32DRAFT_1674584 [Trametes sanguinea]|nr:hypothetical protein FKP32DRAFT_1674584 [Trametes sanguinea]
MVSGSLLVMHNSVVVNPMYYVGFSTATIVASIILFQGINTDDPANSLSLLAGFITTFLGVHLLELSRSPESGRSPMGDGYVRTNGDVVGLETLYEPEPEDEEDGEDERTHLHSRQRGSHDDHSTDRINDSGSGRCARQLLLTSRSDVRKLEIASKRA